VRPPVLQNVTSRRHGRSTSNQNLVLTPLTPRCVTIGHYVSFVPAHRSTFLGPPAYLGHPLKSLVEDRNGRRGERLRILRMQMRSACCTTDDAENRNNLLELAHDRHEGEGVRRRARDAFPSGEPLSAAPDKLREFSTSPRRIPLCLGGVRPQCVALRAVGPVNLVATGDDERLG
jgi:hypothetical protein